MVINMLNYMAIGRRIGNYRKEKNITQATLSELLNVSESYISQVERGVAKISLSRLSSIAKILDVDIAFLVSDHIVMTNPVVNSEIFEITKNWSEEQIQFLIELLICADEQFKKTRKE